MEKQKSDFERTLGWKRKLTSWENFSLDVNYNIGMDIFPRFWQLLAIKTQFVSWRCRRDSLDFHPFNSRLMILFSFWIPFHAPPRRLFFVFLLAAFLSRGIEDQLELGTFLSFPRRCIALYFPMPSISIPTFRPRRFPSLSKPRGAVFVRTCCDFTSPSTLTIWRWSIEATRNLQKDFDIGGHRLVK